MNPTPRGRAGTPLLLAAAAVFSSCAGGVPEVQPVDIPRLEQEVAASPRNTDLQVQLGMARFKGGQHELARATLQDAIDAGNESGPAYLYLGMTQEELEDWSAARAAYNAYLSVGASSSTRARVRGRLTLIGRNLLRAQAVEALAQEQEITTTGNFTPRSVAVLPLAFNSDSEDLEPLIYALSDMMITDFKVSNALVVLERAQIQTLLDEMALTSAGYSDGATGARAGRLLRAEHVFQGVLTTLGDDQEIQTDANILNIPNTASAGELRESAALERLLDMEKQIVIRTIRELLGVELTPAEEQAIMDNRTDNVLAFLAYGRGLRHLDEGDYASARPEFELASSLEPGGYRAAEVALAETMALSDASASSTTDLASNADATGETTARVVAPPSANTTEDLSSIGIPPERPMGAGAGEESGDPTGRSWGTLRNVAEGVFPSPTASTLGLGSAEQIINPTPGQTLPTTRDLVQEARGREGLTSTAEGLIRIIIQRPGGEL